MHVIFRESHGLDEADTPFDLGQSPAELVVLSFSDSDVALCGGMASRRRPRWQAAAPRLANLVALKHSLSVDTYIEQTLAGAKGILIRLIGGVPIGLAGCSRCARWQTRRALPGRTAR